MPAPGDFSRAPEGPLFALLERLGLGLACPNTLHPPVATVAESKEVKTHIPGVHSKNLFMKDKKGTLVLISAAHDTELALNQLHKQIGTQRLSFTDAALLWEALGVTPGSVTAFSLMNDTDKRVRFVLDAALDRAETLNFHPLRNDMTTSIGRADFSAFLAATGHAAEIVDFGGLGTG